VRRPWACVTAVLGTVGILAVSSFAATPVTPTATLSEPAAAPLPLGGPAWHPIDTWRQPQGLPQNSIITIHQTPDGYVWIGTKGGLARFDGVRFTTFEKRSVSETEVWGVGESRDGSLWIATYGAGVQHLKDGALGRAYTKADGLPSDFIMAVCEDTSGAVWAGTDRGLSRVDPATGAVRTYTKQDGLHESMSNGLLCDSDGSVWVGTANGGLHHLEPGKPPGPNQLAGQSAGAVYSMVRDREGAFWVGSSTGVLRLKDGAWKSFGPEDGIADARNIRIHADKEAGIWIGCQSGLYEWHGGRFEHHNIVPDRTQKQLVTAVHRDHEGSVWIGHSALGLARVRRGSFATYTSAHGLVGASVRTAFEDSRGRMWLGTADGLARAEGGRLRAVQSRSKSNVPAVSSIAEDTQGRIWFGSNNGLFRFQPREVCPGDGPCLEDVTEMKAGSLTRVNSRVVRGDTQGRVWLGTDQQGLARYSGDDVKVYSTADGLCENAIRGITEAPDGTIWIGTKEKGLCLFKDERFSGLTEKDGLASNLVQDVYRGRDGTMWVATRRGLSRWMHGRFVSYNVEDGLYADHIYGIMEDLQGNLWMGCSRGAFRVSRADLDAFAEGKAKTVRSRSYGIEDGLRSIVLAVGFAPTIARGADGRVWFATTDGVSVVDPAHVAEGSSIAPQVHVEEVRIDDAVADRVRPAHAPPGKGDLAFRYTALSFIEPRRMAFKVRLEPYDPEWVDVGTLRTRQYTNIPPGRYVFRVKASNADGVWNDTGAQYSMVLAPHFYQTTWFSLLCAAAVLLAATGAYRWRVHALRERERELSRRVEQATAQIKTLNGLLPICASCKKIRDDSGYWNQMETYIHEHSGADFSHSVCPDCMEKLYPEYAADRRQH
jgi:ligand-binding sensor domain-containing protein